MLPATRPLAPGAPVLHTLPHCCPISCDVKIPTFCLLWAETRTAGWAERKQEHFYCIKWKNPLSYQRRAGWAGRRARYRLCRARRTHCSYGGGLGLLLGTEFSTGLGSPLLGMSSALGPGDDLLMFPAREKNGLSSTFLSTGLSPMWEQTADTSAPNKLARARAHTYGALTAWLALCRNCLT